MKRTAIGDGVYRCEKGKFWFRPTINGYRTWRKLRAFTERGAREEARARLCDQSRFTQRGLEVARKAIAGAGTVEGVPKGLQDVKDRLVELKPVNKIVGAVYFLLHNDVCVYVGQSKSVVQRRIAAHYADKEFDRALVLPIVEGEEIDSVEAGYIRQFRPKYNTALLGMSDFFTSEALETQMIDGEPRKLAEEVAHQIARSSGKNRPYESADSGHPEESASVSGAPGKS